MGGGMMECGILEKVRMFFNSVLNRILTVELFSCVTGHLGCWR